VRAVVSGSDIDDYFEIAAHVLPGGFGGLTTTELFLKKPALADSVRRVARILAACTRDEYAARLCALVQTAKVR
jgi:hypothetical protein